MVSAVGVRLGLVALITLRGSRRERGVRDEARPCSPAIDVPARRLRPHHSACLAMLLVALGLALGPSTAKADTDPIVGTWSVTYGNTVSVQMSLSGTTYSVTALDPVELTGGSSCTLPVGTLLATFSGSNGSYTGQHGLWYTSDCSFGFWDPMTCTLASNTLTCDLSGGYGTVVFTKLPGAPGPPQNVSVSPQNGYADLSWNPPADPGTSPITGYVVTAAPYDNSGNSDYFANPGTITEPVPGNGSGRQTGSITSLLEDCHQEYTFTVSAVNADGTGPPSDYGTALVPTRPSPPDATGSPSHFRTSGVVAQYDNQPPVVVVTVDGFGSFASRDAKLDPLVGRGRPTLRAPGHRFPTAGKGSKFRHQLATPASRTPWVPDMHFDDPGATATKAGLQPAIFLSDGTYTATHFLLDQLVAGGGVALPYSYSKTAKLTLSPAGIPTFRFKAYSIDRSRTQAVPKDVKLLAHEVDSIHTAWPSSKIILLGHSGGGLVVEQYWQTSNYQAQSVRLAASFEGPLNGVLYAGDCTPHCPSAFGFGDKILNFLGKLWNTQESNDASILSRDTDGSFTLIVPPGDTAYGIKTNGLFDSIVPDSIFPCGVLRMQHSRSILRAKSATILRGRGTWRSYSPCEWSGDLESAIGGDQSHTYAIVCQQNVDQVGGLATALGGNSGAGERQSQAHARRSVDRPRHGLAR